MAMVCDLVREEPVKMEILQMEIEQAIISKNQRCRYGLFMSELGK